MKRSKRQALSLAAGRAFERMKDEKCRSMGWDYWRNDDDADAFDRWFLEDAGDELNHTLSKVSSWFNQTRKGFLEKLRRIAAYADVGDNVPGKQLAPGVTYDYKSLDLPFVTSAFDFIRDALECLESENGYRFGRSIPHGSVRKVVNLTVQSCAPRPVFILGF
jgi:hypothetical protein